MNLQTLERLSQKVKTPASQVVMSDDPGRLTLEEEQFLVSELKLKVKQIRDLKAALRMVM